MFSNIVVPVFYIILRQFESSTVYFYANLTRLLWQVQMPQDASNNMVKDTRGLSGDIIIILSHIYSF